MLATHYQMVTFSGQTVKISVSSVLVVGHQLMTYSWPRGHEVEAMDLKQLGSVL
jgi:hypothetical protein